MPESMLAVAIEPLRASDLVAVARCIAIDVEAFPYPSAQFGVRSTSARVWIARSLADGSVLGFVAAAPYRGELDIQGLAVRQGSRRRGIGRTLIRAAVDRARLHSLAAISLHVWVGNDPAVRMYQSEGFDIRRRLPGYYRAATFDRAGDAYEMVRTVER